MPSLKISYIGLLLCLQVTAAVPALAQGAAGPPDPASAEGKRAEGKARYERGAEAYSAGRFKDAIDLFLQADALAPSAALSFNIARAYEKIGDDAACLQWYRDFRRRAPDAKNGPEVDQRVHALEGVLARKGVQQFTVLSLPLGATVIVDDEPVGVTPFTGQIPPGKHRVVLSLKGYFDSEQKLDLLADRAQDLNVTLVPGREKRLDPVEAEPAPGAGAATPPPTSAPPSKQASGPRFGVWPWVGLGAGAAVLGGSLGFELSRRAAEKDAREEPTQVGYKQKLDQMQSRQTTARVLAGVGGALALAGGTLLIIDLTSRPKPTQVGFACLPGVCAFDVQGEF